MRIFFLNYNVDAIRIFLVVRHWRPGLNECIHCLLGVNRQWQVLPELGADPELHLLLEHQFVRGDGSRVCRRHVDHHLRVADRLVQGRALVSVEPGLDKILDQFGPYFIGPSVGVRSDHLTMGNPQGRPYPYHFQHNLVYKAPSVRALQDARRADDRKKIEEDVRNLLDAGCPDRPQESEVSHVVPIAKNELKLFVLILAHVHQADLAPAQHLSPEHHPQILPYFQVLLLALAFPANRHILADHLVRNVHVLRIYYTLHQLIGAVLCAFVYVLQDAEHLLGVHEVSVIFGKSSRSSRHVEPLSEPHNFHIITFKISSLFASMFFLSFEFLYLLHHSVVLIRFHDHQIVSVALRYLFENMVELESHIMLFRIVGQAVAGRHLVVWEYSLASRVDECTFRAEYGAAARDDMPGRATAVGSPWEAAVWAGGARGSHLRGTPRFVLLRILYRLAPGALAACTLQSVSDASRT